MKYRVPTRVAFFGVEGSGKSTFGRVLEKTFGHKNVSFAEPLKAACKTIFDFSNEDLYGNSRSRENQYADFPNNGWCFACHLQCEHHPDAVTGEKAAADGGWFSANPWKCPKCLERYPRFVSPRHALKTLGTEWGRRLCTDIWANSLFSINNKKKFVITDARFISENEKCQENGTLRILLTRGLQDSTNTHPSVAEVREMAEFPDPWFDLVLDNKNQALEVSSKQLLKLMVLCEGVLQSKGVGKKITYVLQDELPDDLHL